LTKIEIFQKTQQGDSEKLTNELVLSLLRERLSRFKSQYSQFKTINTTERLNQYIDLVATFQRDLISIHPFTNGNGRTIRIFVLNLPLLKKDLPSARLLDPNSDMYPPFNNGKIRLKEVCSLLINFT